MLLLLSFTSQSQTDTNKDSLVCFPKSIVREIQKDLIRKDLNDSLLVVKDSMIVNRNNKIIWKNSIIDSKNIQLSLYKNNDSLYKRQLEVKDKEIGALNTKVKKQKRVITGLVILEVVKDVLFIIFR